MSTTRIQALLDAQLQSIPGIPAIQLENKRFTFDPSTPFARSTLLPARSTVISLGVGAQKEMQGIYSIQSFYPQDGGSAPAHTMADTIVSAFPIGLALTDGTITVIIQISSVMGAISLQNMYGVPVQVQWSVFI